MFIFSSSIIFIIIIIVVITSLLFLNMSRGFVPEHLCVVVLECSLLRLQQWTSSFSAAAAAATVVAAVAVDEDVEDQELMSTRPVAR